MERHGARPFYPPFWRWSWFKPFPFWRSLGIGILHQLAMVQTILGSIKLFLRLLCAKDTSVKWFWGQTLHPLLFRNVTRTLSMFWTGSQESHLGAKFHKAIAVANLSPQNIYDLGMAIMNITKVCESTHLEKRKATLQPVPHFSSWKPSGNFG